VAARAEFRNLRRLIAWLGVCALSSAIAAHAANDSNKHPHRGVHPQLPAAELIARMYPHASSVGVAIAVVPDPLVPRYRRLYDLSIKAIELGMLKDNYVLDRYSFPWSEELQADSALVGPASVPGPLLSTSGPPQPNPAVPPNDANRSAYGLMVFRCDAWRGDVCGYPEQMSSAGPGAPPVIEPRDKKSVSTQLRVLYVVTDTATQGVAPRQLRCAIRKIQQQVGPHGILKSESPAPDTGCPDESAAPAATPADPPQISMLAYPDSQCPRPPSNPTLVVLGPNFSGAMDSVGEAVSELPLQDNARICLVSSATTDTTNQRVSLRYRNLIYRRLALSDRTKIFHIASLAKQLGFNFDKSSVPDGRRHRNVAVLAEDSTFGYGVCHPPPPDATEPPLQNAAAEYALAYQFCQFAKVVYFPATIADIRYGLQQQQQSNDLASATKQVEGNQHLSLESGAENGSEFPESQESALTSASDQLQLDRSLDELAKLAPRLIVVVATDVRDRLFLFDQLRARMPRALLIDLEADNLLTHPDFLHASRGALAVASADLIAHEGETFGCESKQSVTIESANASIEPWSTDGQGILADSVARLHSAAEPNPPPIPCAIASAPRQAVLQVVTFNGFKSVSDAFPPPPGSSPATGDKPWWRHNKPQLLRTVEIYAPIFCLVLPWIWLSPATRRHWSSRPRRPQGAAMALLTWPELVCLPLFIMAAIVVYTSTLQTTHALTYIVIAVEVAGLWGLRRCDRSIQGSFAATVEGDSTPAILQLSAGLALAAALLAVSPLIWSLRRGPDSSIVDETALIALGFGASSGMAFFLVLALATLVVLSASAGLATGVWIANRNLRVWARACANETDTHPYRLVSSRAAVVPALLIGVLAIPGLQDNLGGARLTIFDPFASGMTIWALSATTLSAAILLCVAAGIAHRIGTLCGYVRYRILKRRVEDKVPIKKIPGKWVGSGEMPHHFAATPILARVADGGTQGAGMMAGGEDQWSNDLSGLLFEGATADKHRLALFVLLASEMSLFRWAAAGAAVCALASVSFVYFYPIEADPLLLLCLAILAAIGLLCAYVTTSFERNEVLSHVLCNRSKQTRVSTAYFIFIAAPFVVLAAAVSIVAIPGVVDWAGGVLAMLSALGVHP
jgi:hypothetical protein